MATDRVTLAVPAKSEYAKTVRMTASALVSYRDITYDEVDDVKMAAEEAFVYAADTLAEGADVKFEFAVSEGEIVMEVQLGREKPLASDEAERSSAYAEFILEAVCDSYELLNDENGARLRVVKRLGDNDAG